MNPLIKNLQIRSTACLPPGLFLAFIFHSEEGREEGRKRERERGKKGGKKGGTEGRKGGEEGRKVDMREDEENMRR